MRQIVSNPQQVKTTTVSEAVSKGSGIIAYRDEGYIYTLIGITSPEPPYLIWAFHSLEHAGFPTYRSQVREETLIKATEHETVYEFEDYTEFAKFIIGEI